MSKYAFFVSTKAEEREKERKLVLNMEEIVFAKAL